MDDTHRCSMVASIWCNLLPALSLRLFSNSINNFSHQLRLFIYDYSHHFRFLHYHYDYSATLSALVVNSIGMCKRYYFNTYQSHLMYLLLTSLMVSFNLNCNNNQNRVKCVVGKQAISKLSNSDNQKQSGEIEKKSDSD